MQPNNLIYKYKKGEKENTSFERGKDFGGSTGKPLLGANGKGLGVQERGWEVGGNAAKALNEVFLILFAAGGPSV